MDKLNKSQHGLEFVMGWDVRKILILTMGPWIASLMTAIVWVVGTGDVQSAMAVATYILTLSGGLLPIIYHLSRSFIANICLFHSFFDVIGCTRHIKSLNI